MIIKTAAAFLCVLMFFPGCKKKDEKDPCEDNAGTGGNVNLKLNFIHHSWTVKNKPNYPDSVYVIFNTLDLPVLDANQLPAKYDMIVTGKDTDAFVMVNGLKCGDYHLYGVAWDTKVGKRVVGGIPHSIAESDTGEKVLTLAVTDGD